MSEATPSELIVRFVSGVPEDDARAAIASLGCSVRRRMRDDSASIVTLLVRGSKAAIEAAAARLAADARVDLVEKNAGGYRALDDA